MEPINLYFCQQNPTCRQARNHTGPCRPGREHVEGAYVRYFGARGTILAAHFNNIDVTLPDKYLGDGNDIAEAVLRALICRVLNISLRDLEFRESKGMLDAIYVAECAEQDEDAWINHIYAASTEAVCSECGGPAEITEADTCYCGACYVDDFYHICGCGRLISNAEPDDYVCQHCREPHGYIDWCPCPKCCAIVEEAHGHKPGCACSACDAILTADRFHSANGHVTCDDCYAICDTPEARAQHDCEGR